jgi:Zn-dependent protease
MQAIPLWLEIVLAAPPLILAIAFHELAHGWVARELGDPTAQEAGRITLNPLKHIDPMGTLILPGLMILLHVPFIFGWAKPVPVDWRRLRHPRRDMALVAAAGPLANLGMLLAWLLILKCAALLAGSVPWFKPLLYMGWTGIIANLVLMTVNLLPIPPLDGGRVAISLLPRTAAIWLNRLQPYGLMLILLLMATGLLGRVLGPILHFAERSLLSLI